MTYKRLMIWAQFILVPCLTLFVLQCGDDIEEEAILPAPLVCQVERLQEGDYEFTVMGITDLCWFTLQTFIASIPTATFYLPEGDSGYPYVITSPGITLPVVGEVTGTISVTDTTSPLQFDVDNQPLSVALNMQSLTQNICSGTLNMILTVTEATLCPLGGIVMANFKVRIDEVPNCVSCTCGGSSEISNLLESASPGCSIIITMNGIRQPG